MRIGGDREQHMALGFIGVAGGDQPLDHRDHLGDVLGGARLDVGRQRPEGGHVVAEGGDGARRQRRNRLVIGARGGVDLVFDIGDVAHIAHMVLAVEVAQQPVEDIKHDERAAITDMGAVVHGRAADIHAHPVRIERFEPLLAAGQRIVECERHD